MEDFIKRKILVKDCIASDRAFIKHGGKAMTVGKGEGRRHLSLAAPASHFFSLHFGKSILAATPQPPLLRGRP